MLKSIQWTGQRIIGSGILVFMSVFFCADTGWAEIRTYKDKNGVIHIEGIDGKEKKSDKKRQTAVKSERTASPAERRAYANFIKKQCTIYGIDSALVRAVIKIESDFNPYCVSPAGAEGIMQLMPDTAKRFAVEDTFDPFQNITGGILYLRYLLKLFKNDVVLAVAAYNAGENAVFKHGGIPPYKETQAYVKNVLSLYKSGYYNANGSVIRKPTKKLYTYYNDKGVLVITTKKPSAQ